MDFSEAFGAAQSEIYRALGSEAVIHPADGSDPVAGHVILRQPSESRDLEVGIIERARPYVRVPSALHRLRQSDEIVRPATAERSEERWRVVEAPSRPDPGHYWIAEVRLINE